MTRLIVATIQMDTKENKKLNIQQALNFIVKSAAKGAKLIALPEVFNFIGRSALELEQAETIPGPTTDQIAAKAVEHQCWISGGSILEKINGSQKVYNTSFIVNPNGKVAAVYRKIHLYDVDVEGGPRSIESKYRNSGKEIVTVKLEGFTVGIAICYDLRFPELFRALTHRGANVILVPAYFAKATAKAHWHALLRARAIENQVYIIAANQTGDDKAIFPAFGHSMIIDPWGRILTELKDGTGVITAEINKAYLDNIRKRLPCLQHIKLNS